MFFSKSCPVHSHKWTHIDITTYLSSSKMHDPSVQNDGGYKGTLSKLRNIVSQKYPELTKNEEEVNLNLLGSKGLTLKDFAKSEGNFFNPPPLRTEATPVLLALQKIANPNSILGSNNQDLFDFIDKQSEHIVQLEKDRKLGNDELTSLLSKVKGIITENDQLVKDERRRRSGQKEVKFMDDWEFGKIENLAESKLDEDNGFRVDRYGKQVTGSMTSPTCHTCKINLAKLEGLNRERRELCENIAKLEQSLRNASERENDATRKFKESLLDRKQLKEDKTQADLEIANLKTELDRYQQNLRELIQENSRKLQTEKIEAEKKYRRELDRLTIDMGQDYEALTKVKLELERQKRFETELRREVQVKTSLVEDLRLEMKTKMDHLQAELSQSLSLRTSIEHDFIKFRLQAEKSERDDKFEANRYRTEVTLLRTRLAQAEEELMKQRKDKMAGNLNSDGDISAIIQTMEDKQMKSIAELEQLIQVQNNLMNNLQSECKSLAGKLEETTHQNKTQMLEAVREGLQSGTPAHAPREMLHELTALVQQMSTWTTKVDIVASGTDDTDTVGVKEEDGGDGDSKVDAKDEAEEDIKKIDNSNSNLVANSKILEMLNQFQAVIDRYSR